MPRYIRRAVRKPRQPDFPLLYKPRPFEQCGDPVGTDARWRNLPSTLTMIGRLQALEIQRRERSR